MTWDYKFNDATDVGEWSYLPVYEALTLSLPIPPFFAERWCREVLKRDPKHIPMRVSAPSAVHERSWSAQMIKAIQVCNTLARSTMLSARHSQGTAQRCDDLNYPAHNATHHWKKADEDATIARNYLMLAELLRQELGVVLALSVSDVDDIMVFTKLNLKNS